MEPSPSQNSPNSYINSETENIKDDAVERGSEKTESQEKILLPNEKKDIHKESSKKETTENTVFPTTSSEEANETSATTSISKFDILESSVITSEKCFIDVKKKNSQKLKGIYNKLNNIFLYASRARPRQPFLANQQNDGRSTSNTRRSEAQSNQESTETVVLIETFPNIFTGPMRWTPSPLAGLSDADVLFVTEYISEINFFIYPYSGPSGYLILNRRGECLFYVIESLYSCSFCLSLKSTYLHVLDVRENEAILLKILCGCGSCFCCYPAIEVYSPPTVPVGAILKKYYNKGLKLSIVDADENEIFTALSPPAVCCTVNTDLKVNALHYHSVVHALDSRKTVVGYIKQASASNFYGRYFSYFAISFPKNMDVRVKALFIGAVFLLNKMNCNSM